MYKKYQIVVNMFQLSNKMAKIIEGSSVKGKKVRKELMKIKEMVVII
jgi:hypothetical protein